MDLLQLKQQLNDNPELIRDILETIDCHHVKVTNKRVQAALPYPSDNSSSVSILLNENLSAEVYSKNDYDYEIKDIFTLIQYVKDNTLTEAIEIVCKICGVKFTNTGGKKIVKSDAYDFLRQFKRSLKKEEYIEEEVILPESFTGRFVREDCLMYLDDGVNAASQKKFGVSYSILENRVIFPIRNEKGGLLSFKGRACNKDYKIMGIPKFINYYPCNNNNYLFGYYQNSFDIMISDELIIFEAEKSVMQCDSFGVNNCVATNKKVISPIQVKKLLKLGKTLIIAFDKDVLLNEIFIECSKFNRMLDIYYLYDNLDLLARKQSPVDCGIEVFQQLIENCKFKYEGGNN